MSFPRGLPAAPLDHPATLSTASRSSQSGPAAPRMSLGTAFRDRSHLAGRRVSCDAESPPPEPPEGRDERCPQSPENSRGLPPPPHAPATLVVTRSVALPAGPKPVLQPRPRRPPQRDTRRGQQRFSGIERGRSGVSSVISHMGRARQTRREAIATTRHARSPSDYLSGSIGTIGTVASIVIFPRGSLIPNPAEIRHTGVLLGRPGPA